MTEGKASMLKDVKDIIFSLLLSIVVSLALILLFGVVLKFTELNDTWVTVINEIIKVVSLLCGICIMCRNKRQVFLKGAVVGAIYYLVVFLIAGGMSGDMSFDLINVCELFGISFAGIIVNIINTSIRMKKQ